MIGRAALLGIVIALSVAAGLFALKDRVQQAEGELRRSRAMTQNERSEIARLRTEWAMLNQPSRLARLAETHLDLEPVTPIQIVRMTDLPYRADLSLAGRAWVAELPSGAAAVLRLKPPGGALANRFLQAGGGSP